MQRWCVGRNNNAHTSCKAKRSRQLPIEKLALSNGVLLARITVRGGRAIEGGLEHRQEDLGHRVEIKALVKQLNPPQSHLLLLCFIKPTTAAGQGYYYDSAVLLLGSQAEQLSRTEGFSPERAS